MRLVKTIALWFLIVPVFGMVDSVWINVELRTDNSASELSWVLRNKAGIPVLNSGTLSNNQLYLDSIIVPKDSCYYFQITDVGANGIASPGYLLLYVENNVVGSINEFTSEAEFYINCQEGESCLKPTILPAQGFFYAGFERNWYKYTPSISGIYSFSTCGIVSCDSRMWLYDKCPIYLRDGAEGALAYNDNKCLLEAEINSYLKKDSTYYFRLEDVQNSCNSAMYFTMIAQAESKGCLDTLACNYDPTANTDDGSCAYSPSTICNPDLAIDQDELKSSLVLDTVQVDSLNYCLINEGCVTGLGTRDILKFSTRVENIGKTDFYLGNPRDNPQEFSNTNCHGHYHYEGYAHYFLLDAQGLKISLGFKNGFCLMDSECDTTTPKFNCQTQGISKGCNDLYDYKTECQWIDVTDIPDGNYTLVNRINGTRKPDTYGRYESNYDNNWAQACVKISRQSGKVVVEKADSCPAYQDCAGELYGSTSRDCNGECGGGALFGDAFSDQVLNDQDVNILRSLSLNENGFPYRCLDLNRDAKIDISDVYLLSDCDGNTVDDGHRHSHPECVFPKTNGSSNSLITFGLESINSDSGFVIVSVNSRNQSVLGCQLQFNGIKITKVQNIDSGLELKYDHNSIQFFNRKQWISTDDDKSVFKVYFSALPQSTSVSMASASVLDSIGRSMKIEPLIGSFVLSNGAYLMLSDLQKAIKLSPNPATNTVQVVAHSSLDKYSMVVLSALGNVIFSQDNVRGSTHFDTTIWPRGLYFVRIHSGQNVATLRLITQ